MQHLALQLHVFCVIANDLVGQMIITKQHWVVKHLTKRQGALLNKGCEDVQGLRMEDVKMEGAATAIEEPTGKSSAAQCSCATN